MPRFFYNTNGFAFHRLEDVISILAEMGYDGLALTPDVHHLDPFRSTEDEVRALRDLLRSKGLDVVIETGARFVLDARRKHRPTLLDDADGADQRMNFLQRCVDQAAILGAPVVTVWSGKAPASIEGEVARQRLVFGLHTLCEYAAAHSIRIGFEPEPGMFVERPRGFVELCRRLGADGADLGLCLDVGHLLCTGDLPVERVIAEFADRLVQVHLDDIAGGVHEHRMFGEGDLDLPATLRALVGAGYDGQVAVELSRDSHRGAWAAEEAMRRIRASLAER